MYYCYEIDTHDAPFLESIIKNILGNFREKKPKELYVLKKEILIPMVDTICKNYNNMIDTYNELIMSNTNDNIKKEIKQKVEIKKDKKYKHQCDKCNRLFKKYSELLKHQNRKHPCNNILKCKKCFRLFNNIHNYNQHINKVISCI